MDMVGLSDLCWQLDNAEFRDRWQREDERPRCDEDELVIPSNWCEFPSAKSLEDIVGRKSASGMEDRHSELTRALLLWLQIGGLSHNPPGLLMLQVSASENSVAVESSGDVSTDLPLISRSEGGGWGVPGTRGTWPDPARVS